ncbi:mucin-22 [Drosophila bipectinata]|uniref:mucin-22 n=1 Tax=Drosophila bipectinata TaxID=42026 RepID=UPI001C8A3DF9|nr:mucin-5AC [Drosophila bipectinata]
MRVDSWLCGGLMLALAVMLTQARFIAKRETAGLEQAVASTSTDPDIVTPARESGSATQIQEVGIKSRLEDEGGGTTTEGQAVPTSDSNEGNQTTESQTPGKDQKSEKDTPLSETSSSMIKDDSGNEASSSLKEERIKKEPLVIHQETTVGSIEVVTRNPLKPFLFFGTGGERTVLNPHSKNETKEALAQETEETPKEPTSTPLREITGSPWKSVTLGLGEEKKPKVTGISDKIDLSSTTESLPLSSTTLGLTTTEAVRSTTRSDHARSMQYSSTTEEAIQILSPVTPMKLRALPMTSTTPVITTSTTRKTTPASATTPTSFASNENAIEESTVRQMPEKRGKFISENSTNAQQLTLPNTAEVWSQAGMKSVPKGPVTTSTTTSTTVLPIFNQTDLANDIELPHNRTEQQKEKNLLDWQQIAMMQSSSENRTEFVVRTTLDATEGATQATTEALKEESNTKGGEIIELDVEPERNSTAEMEVLETVTSTTARTELFDVPLVKQMAEAAKAKLTEAQTEVQAITEATTAMKVSTEPTATSSSRLTEPVTARVALEKSELPLELNTTQAVTARVALENSELPTTTKTTTTTTEATSTTKDEPLETATEEVATSTAATPKAATSEATTATAINLTSSTPTSTTEMAMKAAHDYKNNDNSADVDNSSNDVIVATTKQPEPEPEPEREQLPVGTTATSVSVQVAGEASSSTTNRPVTDLPDTGAREASTIASTTTPGATPTPTQTEIAQISNEVNLEAVTVKSARDREEDTGDKLGLNNANELITAEKTDNAVNNSVVTTESERQAVTKATATTTPPATSSTTTTTTEGGSTLLSDFSKLSKEHESSLETNNIGEASESTTPAGVATDESTAAEATGGQESEKELHHHEVEQVVEEQDTERQLAKTTMAVASTTSTTTTTSTTSTTTSTTTTTTTTETPPSTTTTMQPPLFSLLDDTTTRRTTIPSVEPATEDYTDSSSPEIPAILSSSTTTTSTTTTSRTTMLPETSTTTPSPTLPPSFAAPYPNELDHMQSNAQGNGTDVNVIIAITVSVIGVVALILLVAFLYLMRKRQKQMSYGQRCRPVSLDAYSLDNVSVLGSVRRKGRDVRASKRTYGNAAFDDPSLRHNPLTAGELARFVEQRSDVFEEFRDVPQIIARADEVPPGCEDKNRYANVIPLPETRVVLQRQGDDDKTEYINANYVRGPRDAPNYYIACQAPMESTTSDFWRMIWEQQSRVIIQATDLSENGIEKCAEYLPPSATLDNHSSYGDYQVTLKHREVKDKYAISTLMLKRVDGEESRELTHYWYKWPETGVPAEEAPIIAMLLEARSSLKSYCLEQAIELRGKSATLETSMDAESSTKTEASSTSSNEINGNISSRSAARNQQGPLTVHCSPGTGRTGTIIASDMAIRSLETPKRSVDIPQLVYYVRRGRASAVQTKEQYEFIYKVASMYAAKITNLSNDN